ncbi:helix-turn-helix transcriptional regulator [Dactylosporangium sp. NPDC005555]|uniref:helix-turn-helix domain-containing protein n=1 Tax=Dactylosporangium sp. NPDC005555 TaxID=3154889 RepID=UPI0033A8D621
MSLRETPAVARRTVRLAIRDARTARGFTQDQVAEAMEWSRSKVMRIESGEHVASRRDLVPLLAHLGIDDESRVEGLVRAAKAARRQGPQWWDEQRFGDLLTPAMKQWFTYEAEATSILAFNADHFPGFLQTAQTAGPVLDSFADDLPVEQRTARLEARSLRRQALVDRRAPLTMRVLLDESLLHRTLGRPGALQQQARAVLDAVLQGWATVRIAPFTQPSAGTGNFDIALLGGDGTGDDAAHAVLYRERGTTDEVVDDPATLDRYLTVWRRMWDHALDESRSTAMLSARAGQIAGSRAPTRKRTRGKNAP